MGLKIFGTGGVDQKSNHLLREDMDMVDSRNIMRTVRNEYDKRPGTDEDTLITGSFSDVIFIKSMNEYFYRNGGSYKTVNPDTLLSKTPFLWRDEPSNTPSSNISLAEYLSTAIFTHEENPNYTAKYDGRSIYCAGLPAPVVTVSSGSGTGYFLLTYFDYVDAQGNQLFGPATITQVGSATPTISYETIPLPFYNGVVLIDPTPNVVIDSSNRTVTTINSSLDFDHTNNFCVGTKIPIRETQVIPNVFSISISDSSTPDFDFGDYVLMLEIESITSTTITFTAESIGTKKITIAALVSNSENILGSYKFRAFISTSETTGYVGLRSKNCPIINNANITESFEMPNAIVLAQEGILLSDVYDITTSKLRPPKCKYLLTYGFQLVCGNVLSFWDFKNREITYTNNDLVMYSDVSTGDLGESFSEINRQLIGDTYDGNITGLTRSRDSLIVTKDRQLFALDGVLIPGQYSMRKIETNEIGCNSFKSILNVDSGFLFQGQDGIYACDGYRIKKISTPLDPFFLNVDFKKTRSVMNSDFDQYLFWTDQGVVVFDYETKKWYIWDSIDASSGITVDNKKSIRFFSADKAAKFINQFNDFGNPINAYIMSSWFNMGEPGLLKKATFMRIYAFHPISQKIDLKYYFDWSLSNSKGPFTIKMDPNTPTVKRNFDIIQKQSFLLEFRNNYLNEGLNISGYEIDVDVVQTRDKNVK